MNQEEREAQQALHDAIERVLEEDGTLDDALLAGWIVVYETASLSEKTNASAGHFYGPVEMTTWRAMGLVEWARMTLRAAVPDEDDDE